jgi:hypothetical protein
MNEQLEGASQQLVTKLVPGRSDIELAKEIRADFAIAIVPVCEILDRAIQAGFVINFTVGPNVLGRQVLKDLTIAKHL